MDSPDSCRISVPGSTQVPDGRQVIFTYGTITLYGWLLHTILLTTYFVTSMCQALQPRASKLGGLGCSHFARHYSGNDLFSSGYLDVSVLLVPFTRPIDSAGDDAGSQQRVSPFGNLRIKACLPLPEAYRSLPRPSSPTGAKAFTMRSYLT